jgi:opacity protein-like surface antigen
VPNVCLSRFVGIGFDLLRLRLPLVSSEEFPKGRLQPYISAGPALFVTWAESDPTLQPPNQKQTDTSLGVKAGGGLAFLITKSVAVFGEYRFTHFTTDLTFQDTTPPPSTENFKMTFDTHHLIGGLSFRF